MRTRKWIQIITIILLCALVAVLTAILVIGTRTPNRLEKMLLSAGEGDYTAVKKQHSVAEVSKLDVRTTHIKCHVYTTQEEELQVVLQTPYEEDRRATVAVTLEAGVLQITIDSKPRIGWFTFTTDREYVEVYIPERYQADLQLQTASGSIAIESSLSVRNLTISGNSGSLKAAQLTCETYEVKSDSGSIKMGTLAGSGTLQSKSGSVQMEALQGKSHTVQSNSGSIRLGEVRGDLEATSDSGSLKIEFLEGDFVLESSSGTLRANEVIGGGNIKNNSGSVQVEALTLTGNLQLENKSGSIRATFAAMPSAALEVNNHSGSVRTNFVTKGGQDYQTATLGDGTYQIMATNTSGSIVLEVEDEIEDLEE